MSKQREASAPAPRRTADVIWRELSKEERVEAARVFWESEYSPKQARDFATELVSARFHIQPQTIERLDKTRRADYLARIIITRLSRFSGSYFIPEAFTCKLSFQTISS